MSKLQSAVLLAAQASVADGATLDCSVTPFVVGSTVTAEVNCDGFTGTCVIEVSETSDFASTTDYTVTGTTTDKTKKFFIKLGSYIRGTVTVRSAGSVDVHLLS